MNLEEKKIMLENIINEISLKGHDNHLLQQLIKCYLDIYLAKDYQILGDYIDMFQSNVEIACSNFFGQIIKTGKGTAAEDDSLGSRFTNGFRASLVHNVIKKNESLKQIYTSLGVLDNTKEHEYAQFWWNNVVNALTDFDFEHLCQIVPNGNLTNGSLQMYSIRENDLITLLMEKKISPENYSIDYGTIYGGEILIIDNTIDDIFRKKIKEQKQKGLYINYLQ